MKYIIIFSLVFSILVFNVFNVYAQQPLLASFHEAAQVLVDQKFQNQTTVFIGLESTSPLEMRVPAELDQKIRNTANITSVTITNAQNCVLGVPKYDSCVLVTIDDPSLVESYNITKIQTQSKAIGDSLIDNINSAFHLNSEFNNVYINPKGEFSNALGTSGAVSGNRTISIVYTMSSSKSDYLFDGFTSILLPPQIKDAGGFLDAAKKMSSNSNSSVTFTIIPRTGVSMYQLQVSERFPIKSTITTISPLDLFGVDNLDRSSYFNAGFFPLNSILQVTLLSNQPITITDHGGDLVPTQEKNGQKIPSDLTKAGWLFDPSSGSQITGVYLFGTTVSASKNDLTLTIGNGTTGIENPVQPPAYTPPPAKPTNVDYSPYVLIGIVAAAGVAIYIFLRKR
ncbi:MAG: hypothetical protein HY223_04515 [Thaumarchaeota archaeon]|nr:hypothetical protein [Nitrososphaerota archaeon]MBI3639562.1 hypothetical protein [Nitrososphaerota archaeon]